MTSDEFLEQLEIEKSRRESELVCLNNVLKLNFDKLLTAKSSLKRANICLIYAHIEGFVRFSFLHYITAINQLKLKCRQVTPIFRAATYYDDFYTLTNQNHKSKIFKSSFPFDNHLHRLYRHSEFFSDVSDYLEQEVNIKDNYINTESNVGKEVLEKLLYQVGLPHDCLSKISGTLAKLKNKRNDISHGVDISEIKDKDYDDYYSCAVNIMSELQNLIYEAYNKQKYLISV